MATADSRILFCFSFHFILDVLLHNVLLKHSSNESLLLSTFLEFQDGQTYSKESKDELSCVQYSLEYKVIF